MSVLFFIMTFASIGFMLFAKPEAAIAAALSGAENAVTLTIKMLAVYALWLGVLGVMQKNGVTKFFSRLFRPLTKKLFKGEKEETLDLISQNLAANFLGVGGAATPLGIRATALMQGEETTATENVVLFIVLNACGVQLIPGTIIALRASAGSANPSDIFLPTVLCTLVTASIGVTLCFLFRKKK